MFGGQVGGLSEKRRANRADDANGSMLDGAPLGIKKTRANCADDANGSMFDGNDGGCQKKCGRNMGPAPQRGIRIRAQRNALGIEKK
jgi:hypothetical protein